MPRSLHAPIALLLASALTAASAQAPVQKLAPQQPAAAPITTIKARTQIVIVDVTVTDAHQQPVHNLKAADFTLRESKNPQTIRNFEEHTAAPPAAPEPMPPMPPGTFTNFTPVPANSALNIVLLDTLNTPLTDQIYVHHQLLDFLKHAPADSRIAVFGLTSKLIMLQGFTSDPAILKEAVAHSNGRTSHLLDNPNVPPLSEAVAEAGGLASIVANLQQFASEEKFFQIRVRAKYTLDAMNVLARYLSGLPGRKNLIWFSGSFPLSIMPDGDLQNPFTVVANSEDEFRETTALLARSQVAVYPVDARGLMVSPNMSAADSGARYTGRNGGAAFAKDEAQFFHQTAAEHATMLALAQQTGGKAYINTNGLTHAVADAIDSGSNYYTLTYSPTNTAWKGDYRKVELKLKQAGYTLSYRRGYYAVDPDKPASPRRLLSSRNPSAPSTAPTIDPLSIAMARGTPTPSQIIFKARILPVSTASEAAVAPGNILNPDPKTPKGPYRRFNIDLAANLRDFFLTTTPDHLYQGKIEVRTYLFDRDGVLILESTESAPLSLPTDRVRAILETGLQIHTQVSAPLKGEYYLRIGIQDLSSDHIGAIEVPIAAVKNLAPLPPPPAPPASQTPTPAPSN